MNTGHYYTLIELLTRQREANGLCTTMAKIINELTGAKHIKLYMPTDSTNSLVPTEESAANASPTLSRCLTESDLRIVKNIGAVVLNAEHPFIQQDGYLVMPLYSDLNIIGMIIIDKQVPEEHLPLLKLTLRIFVNQYTLINYCMKDALTGLLNRQAFDKTMKRLINGKNIPSKRNEDKPGDWYFALADIDHFKQINDKFGHVYGDEVLLLFSRIMHQSLREDDLLFRYGGEEFAIALRNVTDATSGIALERLRRNVENYHFPQVGRVTISIGYTSIKADKMIAAITDAADKALYFAKEHGRNQVHHYDLLVKEGAIIPPNYSNQDVELF